MNALPTDQSDSQGSPSGRDDLIAVTALDCRFPDAPDTEAFWDLLVAGRSGLSRRTEEQLAASGVPNRLRHNPAYVPVGGVIDGQDLFDPEPFGLTESEAAVMDPQQRLFLEACWRALERAGHGSGAGAGAVGVFAGSAHSDYLTRNLGRRYADSAADPVGSLQAAVSGVADYLPMHVAHRLALTGPALAVGTACSTSLVAVHLAAQSLLAGECDTALAGGASLIVPQGGGYLHVPDGIFSVDGRVRTFSAEGTGIVHSQGVGVTVLRRLGDALADGDPVLAVLHGSAVNNDGGDRTAFTAPSPRGQARAISEALSVAGLAPDLIGYVEAHGTATRLGDMVELAALKKVFGKSGPAWCALGSVKSNIGHANAAAGIAGFAKTVLALHHGVLPPSLGAVPLNPDLELEDSPFTVPDRAREWTGLRHAGVSSFGIGGTNCHVILGSATPPVTAPADSRPQLALLSAHRSDALEQLADATSTALAQPGTDAADAAYTLHTGRGELPHRTMAVLDGTTTPLASAPRRTAPPTRPRIVLAFPGGGTQYPGMGHELLRDEPEFARTVEECAALFDARDSDGGPGLAALLTTADRNDRDRAGKLLRDPVYGLPALFTTSLATARTLSSWGIEADALVGHSLGEYTAAVVAGALRLSDAVALVDVRSRGMSRTAGNGVMLSVALPENEIMRLLDDHPELDLAAVNAPRSCVVSGPVAAVARLEQRLAPGGVHTARLHLSAASHCRLIDPVLPELRAAAEAALPSAPATPLATTLTGQLLQTPPGAEHWVSHLRSVVRFADALKTALGTEPAAVVQVGPGTGLLQLVRQQGAADVVATLPTFPGREDERGARATLLAAAGELWTHGVRVGADAMHRPGRRRIALPGLPFDRRRLWIDPPGETPGGRPPVPYATAAQPEETYEDEPFQVPVWYRTPPADAPGQPTGRWLVVGDAGSPLLSALRGGLAAAGGVPVAIEKVEGGPLAPCAGIIVADTDGDSASGEPATHVADAVLRYARVARAAAPWAGTACLLHVSTGAQHVESDDRPAPGGAAGIAVPRVLAQEFPGLRWRALDLPAGPVRTEDVRRVCAEAAGLAADGPSGVETAYRGGHRWVRGLVPWQPPETEGEQGSGTAVVIGGLGDVGLALAGHLARGGRRVVVTGRAGLPSDPAPGSPQAERAEAVARLREEGLDLDVRAVDAADADATAALLRDVTEQYGPLDLVVHGAGVVASAAVAPLRAVTEETVRAHARAKVSGALALHSALLALPRALRPGTVLLMSSATAFVGGLGLAPYAAVNRFLDALAEREDLQALDPDTGRGRGTRWISVAWDGWRVGPGGTERVVASRHSIGLRDGMRSVDRLLGLAEDGRAPASLAVSPADLAARTAGLPPTAPAASPGGQPGHPPRQRASAPRGVAEELLDGLWSELLGFPVTDRDADFFALGGHSLLATRMLARLRDERGVELRLQDLLARPTIATLATLIPAGSTAPPRPEPRPEPGAEAGHPAAVSGEFPLTRVQHAYWVGGSGGYRLGDVPCSFHLEYDCPGLDTARYEEAWNQVIARHPMLRAVISPEGRNRILDRVPRYRIRVQDLSALGEEQRMKKLAQIRARMVRREPRPGRWPLVDIQAARLPGDVVRLFVNVDVLVCDTASYLIWDRELRARYEDPGLRLPPVGTTFQECVAALEQRADSPERTRAAAYWRAKADSLPGAPALPLRPAEDGTRPRFGRRSARLEPERWDVLKAAAARRGLTPTAVLLAAYGDALADWSGQKKFDLTLTLFDRPTGLPGVDEVVGDFTSLMLHTIDRSGGGSFADAAAQAQNSLFEDLDHRSFSALELLAEKSARTGRTQSVPVVFTSALGLSGPLGGGHDLDWAGTQVYGVSSTPQTWLDHQVLEQHGALLLQWDVLESELSAQEADRAFAAYVARLRDLAQHPAAWDERREPDRSSPPARRRPGSRSAPEDSDAALLLREGNGDRPLFLVHPSGGDVLCYSELAGLLTDGRPVVALADPALTGGKGADSIADMADSYLAAIRGYQSTGPYLLGGWSMGGTLAHAMACELARRGESAELLVMIDSNVPDRIRPLGGAGPDEDEAIAAVRYLRSLEAFLDMDLGLRSDEAEQLLRAPSPHARSAVASRLREAGLAGPRESADVRLGVFERHLHALGSHRAGHLASHDTRLLLFRAAQPSPSNAGVGMGVDDAHDLDCLGWRPHMTGQVEDVALDGHHYSLLTGPAAARIAALIDQALAALRAAPGSLT